MGRSTFVLDCSSLPRADLEQLDAVARLRLCLGRRDCDLELANASGDLRALIDLAGLAGVLRVEPGRETEEGEEPGGVEEEGELGDPPL
jgi:hypothetical protein